MPCLVGFVLGSSGGFWSEVSKSFFFEKKKQKTFGLWGRWQHPCHIRQ
jgi:hypothetical protein